MNDPTLAALGPLRAVLIDDEPAALAALRTLLTEQTARPIHVVGEAATIPAARALLGQTDYEAVFLDIQLRGGTGFDLVPCVRAGARIVFVTTHDDFTLRAFEVNALDYLLKPVAPARLATTLGRLGLAPRAAPAVGIDEMVFVETDGAACFVPARQVASVLSGDNYSEVRLTTGRHLLVRRPLAVWEATLPASHFARAHRQALVNLVAIEQATPLPDERGELRLTGWREPLVASRRLWPALRGRLAELRLQRTVAGE
jgi:two-component system LytT family response regulator